MEFFRISENMIKCEVTEDDLLEFNVSIEDFFSRSDSAMELLQEIVRQAEIEVDYKPDGPLTTLQIAPAGGKGLTIFLAEKQRFDLASLLRGLRDYGGVPIDEEVFKKVDSSTGAEQMGFFNKLLENIRREVEKNASRNNSDGESSGKIRPKESGPAKNGRLAVGMNSRSDRVRVFAFDKIGDVMNYASSLSRVKGYNSGLYKNQADGRYYLVIERGGLGIDEYAEIILGAHEYGRFLSDNEQYVSYVKEHCECIVSDGALGKIRG